MMYDKHSTLMIQAHAHFNMHTQSNWKNIVEEGNLKQVEVVLRNKRPSCVLL